jgi:hypothetical protein
MELLQDVVVTLVAAGAAGVVVWRVVTAGKSDAPEPPCATCAGGPAHRAAGPTESQTGAARRG